MSEKRDRRRHPRRLTLKFGDNAPVRTGFTYDVSRHGMFIKSAYIYPPKTVIRIELTLPDKRVVNIEGEVRWAKKVPTNLMHIVHKFGMGIEISRILSGQESYDEYCDSILIT